MVLLIFLVFSFCFLFSFSLLCVISSRVSGYVSAAQNIKRNRKKSAKKTCIKISPLLKLGKSKDILKYICLSFISFLPLFYFCCIYYFGSLIFCCQFVARTFIFDYFGLYPSFLVISLMHQNSAFPFVDSPSTYS